jgi:hypothetical protein
MLLDSLTTNNRWGNASNFLGDDASISTFWLLILVYVRRGSPAGVDNKISSCFSY